MDHDYNTRYLSVIMFTGIGTIGGDGLGPFGAILNWDIGTISRGFASVVSSIIGVFTIAAFVWFLIHILVAGLRWLESEGDKNKLEEAQNRLTNAFIGLIIVVAGWAILALASEFFGIPNILNPGTLINQLQFGTGSPSVPVPNSINI